MTDNARIAQPYDFVKNHSNNCFIFLTVPRLASRGTFFHCGGSGRAVPVVKVVCFVCRCLWHSLRGLTAAPDGLRLARAWFCTAPSKTALRGSQRPSSRFQGSYTPEALKAV